MSKLGADLSPVSAEISLWWVVMGVLIIIFGLGLRNAFDTSGKYAKTASWFVILYGLGEGLGSAVFPANHSVSGINPSVIIHDILGGIGVFTIILLPLVMLKIQYFRERKILSALSKVIFIAGIVFLSLFLFRYFPDANYFISTYKGLWQRLFMLDIYIYLIVIAIIMLKIEFGKNSPKQIVT